MPLRLPMPYASYYGATVIASSYTNDDHFVVLMLKNIPPHYEIWDSSLNILHKFENISEAVTEWKKLTQ